MTEPASVTSKRPLLTLILVTAASVLLVVDVTIVIVGLPVIERDLGGSLAGFQWIVIAYTLTYGSLLQVSGSLSDQIGRRRMFLGGVVVFTAASVACGLAWDVVALDVFRAVQGIGGAMVFANAMPLIAQEYSGQRRNMAIAIWSAALGSGGALGPLIGGVVIEAGGWRWMFLINVPIGLAVLVFGALTLSADHRSVALRRIDWAGAGLVAGALVLVNLALTRGEAQGWSSAATIAQAVGGLLLLAAFVRVERRVAAPMLDLGLFAIPSFTGVAVLSLLSRMVVNGAAVYLAIWLQQGLGKSAFETGLFLLPAFLATMPAGLLAGRLQAKMPVRVIVVGGLVLLTAGTGLLAMSIGPDATLWSLLPGMVLWGLGGGLAGTPLMSLAIGVVPADRAGMASGMTSSFLPIGSAAGIAVLGVVFTAGSAGAVPAEALSTAASGVLAWSAGFALVAIAVALLLIRQRDLDREAEDRVAS